MSRLIFHSLGSRGRYTDWVRELDGESGAYVIKDAEDRRVLYVGESHTGNLYGTLTRHFQRWNRDKRFWEKAGFSKHDPGLTYSRSRVVVAVRVTRADLALRLQRSLIRALRPRDNVLEAEPVRRRRKTVDTSGLPPIPF